MNRYRKRIDMITDGTYHPQSVAHEIGKDCRITDVFGCCISPNDMRFQVDGCYFITPTDIILLKDYPELLQKDVHISFLIDYEKEEDNNMRLIDADEAKKYIEDRLGKDTNKILINVREWTKALIDAMPTIQAAPIKKGHWIWRDFDEDTGISKSYWCSECNKPLTGLAMTYCACCGAKMIGG